MTTIKCESCGAIMKSDANNSILYCPYCGFSLKQPENAIDYAKFVLHHNEEVRRRMHEESKEENKKNIRQAAVIFLVIFTIIALMLVSSYYSDPNRKLESAVSRIQQMILDGKYDEALIEVQTIRIEKKGLFDSNYDHWENQRKDLIKLIEQKQKEKN